MILLSIYSYKSALNKFDFSKKKQQVIPRFLKKKVLSIWYGMPSGNVEIKHLIFHDSIHN